MPVCARHRLHPHLDPDSVPRPPLMRLAHGGRRHLINVAGSEELGGGSGGPTPSTMPLPVRVTLTPLPSKPSRPATSSAQTHQGSAQRQRGRREKISSMWYPSHLRFRSHFARGAKCAHKSQPRTLRGQDSRPGRATTVALCGIFSLQTRGKSQPHPALTPPTAFAPMTTRLSRCGEKVQQREGAVVGERNAPSRGSAAHAADGFCPGCRWAAGASHGRSQRTGGLRVGTLPGPQNPQGCAMAQELVDALRHRAVVVALLAGQE